MELLMLFVINSFAFDHQLESDLGFILVQVKI